MAHIKITKGLDIPIKGKPQGHKIQPIAANGHYVHPRFIGLDLSSFEDTKFKILTNVGDIVKIGQPLLENKALPGVMMVSPAAGIIREIRRGLKRSLKDISIETIQPEEFVKYEHLDVGTATRQQIIDKLKEGGLFPHIRRRPFNLLTNPEHTPRSIFVKAIESSPFAVPPELQVAGHENEFQDGLNALAKLTDGTVNLVYRKDSTCSAFTNALNVQKHTAEGPHPIANQSVHIQAIDPIAGPEDVIWTLNVHTVISIGHLLMTGKYYINRIISIAGPGILPDKVGYFSAREGYSITDLIAGRLPKGHMRLISGDVLTGKKVESTDFLGFYHYGFCVVPENTQREFLHFFRLGTNKFTASRAYLSGIFNNSQREYDFTTSQHGEKRAFVTSSPYEKVMPLRVPTMELVKSVMAEDYDLAETLGLLEVDSEDFALPTFVDPSKIEMVDIIKQGLRQHAKEVGVQ